MARRKDRFAHHFTSCQRPLLFAVIAFSLSACNQTPDIPSPGKSPPKPETSARHMVSSGLRKAIYSYSGHPDLPFQIETPATAIRHPTLET